MGETAPTFDRRAFLRRVGSAVLVAPAAPLLACGDVGAGRARAVGAATGSEGAADAITRPILLPWSEAAVRIDAPAFELPVAYVSRGRRQLFVDHDFRDQVYWDLRAHISVSTGVWRIPLAGDPPREPIMPGDPLREFEELTERDWDPSLTPSEGDVRILRGVAVSQRVELSCAPLAGGGAWFRAGPWEILQCSGPGAGLCREDFMSIGSGMRYTDRDCTRPDGSVDFLTWACRPGVNPAVG